MTKQNPRRLMLLSNAAQIMARVPNSETVLITVPREWVGHYRSETLASRSPTEMHLSCAHVVPFDRDDLQAGDIIVASLNDDEDALTFWQAKELDGRAAFVALVDHWDDEPRRDDDLQIFARLDYCAFTMNYADDLSQLTLREYERPNPEVTNPAKAS